MNRKGHEAQEGLEKKNLHKPLSSIKLTLSHLLTVSFTIFLKFSNFHFKTQNENEFRVCTRHKVDFGLLWTFMSRCVIKCQGHENYLSRLMGKPTICIGEIKDADQLRGNREADQRLCFRYSDSAIPLLSKSKISSF